MDRIIILANGSFPRRAEARQALQQARRIVCCDGAYARLVESGLLEDVCDKPEVHVVGDGDSLTDEIKDHPPFPTVFTHWSDDQECNDLTKAVRYAVSQGAARIVILGATGLREDHTLGNISLLGNYAAMRTLNAESGEPLGYGKPLEIRMYTDYGFFTPLVVRQGESETFTLPSFPRQQVSLFALGAGLVVSVEGLRYPLRERVLNQWWEATLNEAMGDSFRVTLRGSVPLLVYQTHVAK